MQELPRRLMVLIMILATAMAVVWAMGRRAGRYGLWDLLRGQPATVFAPEQYTVPTEAALEAEDVPLLERLNAEYAKLTAAVIPSVVSIDTSETVAVQSGFPGYYRQYQRPGLGSGVIVTPEGHVITNHHVVANKDAIRVTRTTEDGRRESAAADLVGSLVSYDIAVLKIRSGRRDFPALKMGDSRRVKVGQLALAVGNPYGLAESVTQGIISALDRRISDAGPSYFQTDTPINPGNSGGPLVNFRGEVIGINSVVLRGPEADRAAQNIGFAIPAQQAWEAFQIITGRGRPVFGYLGLALLDVTPPVAAALGMPGGQGAMVQGVMSGSPAAVAGLKPPDVIQTLDGEAVTSYEAFVGRIRAMTPGTEVRLGVWRDGRQAEIRAQVGDTRKLPAVSQDVTASPGAVAPGTGTITLAQARQILQTVGLNTGMAVEGGGVRVESVVPGSLAADKIQYGDRITKVNGAEVGSPAAFNRAVIEGARAGAIVLEVGRGSEVLQVELGR